MKLILPTLLAAALLAPATALADTVAPDPDARQVTALRGTLVWTSGESPTKLMQRAPDGTVTKLAQSTVIRHPDLGRDAKGRLVLTYTRCKTFSRCIHVRDDLRGNRSTLSLAPARCTVSSTPAVWRSSIAYGLACFKLVKGKQVVDAARSGLYLKKAGKKPIRFTAPRDAKRAGALEIRDVDLRGSQIAAVYADIAEYAVVQSTTGSLRHAVRVASSEGDGDQRASGVTIGTGDARLWTLTRSFHAESAPQSIVHRFAKGCDDYQTLTAPEGSAQEEYPLTDLAVDGGTLYAVDPGVGIVTHAYARTAGC